MRKLLHKTTLLFCYHANIRNDPGANTDFDFEFSELFYGLFQGYIFSRYLKPLILEALGDIRHVTEP